MKSRFSIDFEAYLFLINTYGNSTKPVNGWEWQTNFTA